MKKLAVMIIFFSLFRISFAPEIKKDRDCDIERYFISAELSQERLLAALRFNNVISPEVVLSQGKLETGYFRSQLCRKYNNLFGMKWPWGRINKSSGHTENGFAVYVCWYDAVLDMKLFQAYYMQRGKDLNNYFSFLEDIGYAEESDYIIKLEKLCTSLRLPNPDSDVR